MIFMKKLNKLFRIPSRQHSLAVDSLIKTSKIGQVTCIGLNRPKNKNCLNLDLLKQLQSTMDNFQNDQQSLVGVIYGEQGNFSHGYDHNEMNENLLDLQKLLVNITSNFTKKPLIAAISGFAVGPGFELALWCDFRVVEETAVMAAFARTYGVPLSDITAKRLCSLVGIYRALDWALTGRFVKAKEALDCGIATRVVACGTSLGQAVNFANSLCNMPQACLKADRATLLSISDKFSPEVKSDILREKEENLKIALTEVKQGIHLTESGDVRRKDNIS